MNEPLTLKEQVNFVIGKLRMIFVSVAAVVVVFYAIQFILSFPPRKFNNDARDISVIKEIIENNKDLYVVFSGQDGYYNIDGECLDMHTLDVKEGCLFSGDIEYTHYEMFLFPVYYKDAKQIFIIATGTLSFSLVENGKRYATYSSYLRTQPEVKAVEDVYVQLSSSECLYAPYDFFASTCFFGDISKAKKVLNDHYDFLEEIGLSDIELNMYFIWFLNQLNHAASD